MLDLGREPDACSVHGPTTLGFAGAPDGPPAHGPCGFRRPGEPTCGLRPLVHASDRTARKEALTGRALALAATPKPVGGKGTRPLIGVVALTTWPMDWSGASWLRRRRGVATGRRPGHSAAHGGDDDQGRQRVHQRRIVAPDLPDAVGQALEDESMARTSTRRSSDTAGPGCGLP